MEIIENCPVRTKIKEVFGSIGISLPIGPTPLKIRDKIWICR